jgi:hemolysin activation/secretion protein
LIYFTDTTQAYNVDLQFTVDSILGTGDLVYVYISNDNATWSILDTIAGNHVAAVYTIPINAYVPGPVYIKFVAYLMEPD